jgi:hypothetical protein
VSDDGSTVEYRSGDSWITFQSYVSRFSQNRSGARIDAHGVKFEAARIDCRYFNFVHVGPICEVTSGWDDDRDDWEVVEHHTAGWFNEGMERVMCLCRAQWNGKRIRGTVISGIECDGSFEPLPEGYPDDWPPIQPTPPGEVTAEPSSLTLTARPDQPTASRNIRIRNSHAVAKEISVGPVRVTDDGSLPGSGPLGTFDNTNETLTFTLPSGGERLYEVSFTGEVFNGPGIFQTARALVPISVDGGSFSVRLQGKIAQVAQVNN